MHPAWSIAAAIAIIAAMTPARALETPQTTPLPDVALPEAARARAFPQVFGTSETAGSSLAAFRRWGGVIERSIHEWLGYGDPCSARLAGKCTTGEWRLLVARLADRPRRERIDKVNAFFNRIPYVVDASNWGVADYWATPLQFLSRSGDCEDYAIAKYTTLRLAGVATERLRLIYVRARTSPTVTEAHMVLGYYAQPTDEPLILDNLITSVRPASQRPDLSPVYSFNSDGLWVGGSTTSAADPTVRLSRWRDLLDRMRQEGF